MKHPLPWSTLGEEYVIGGIMSYVKDANGNFICLCNTEEQAEAVIALRNHFERLLAVAKEVADRWGESAFALPRKLREVVDEIEREAR